MIKYIVTHFNPDLDAICSIWLLKKFAPEEFGSGKIKFVAAGNTYQPSQKIKDEEIIHVDTGLGKFDHHQTNNRNICSASVIFEWLKEKNKKLTFDSALIQLIKVVTEIDHFAEVSWPQNTNPRYAFMLDRFLDGLKISGKINDYGLVKLGLKCLDGVYFYLKMQNKAEKELTKGFAFNTKWGKAIACLSSNNEILKLGQKKGYVLVVQKDNLTDHIRIKARPDSNVDLTSVYYRLKKLDPEATWFLHISKKMLLNGSTKNDKMKASKLSLKKVIEVIEKNGA